MESTTLVTFMLQHPTARKVELLGSWDNFSTPYGMERDRRRGRGVWTGCHTFHDIICDGDERGIHEKRAGGLKMGGTYWYFYRVDDDEEFFDPDQETTTACPLMPGQTLNVLDVPSDVEQFSAHSRSASMVSLLNIVKTLNPEDRYTNPQPAAKKETKSSFEAIKTQGHIPAAPSQYAERPISRKRRWSSYLSSQRSEQDHPRSCAHRSVQSAPASPLPAAARYFAPIIPPQQATFASQHAFTSGEPAAIENGWHRDWAARRKSVGQSQWSDHDDEDVSQYCALEDLLLDEHHTAELNFGDQWPLAPPTRQPPPPPTTQEPAKDPLDHYTFFTEEIDHDHDESFFMSGALPVPTADHEPLTPPITLLPQQSYFDTQVYPTTDTHTNTNMHKALQALDEQYTIDQGNSPWRSNTQLPLPSVIESTSDAVSNFASPIFSSIHGDHISDTCTSHRLSELRSDWPLKPNFADFDFQLEETSPADVYSSFEPADVYSSFEHLSIHTTETVSTTSTAVPPIVPRRISGTDDEAIAELRASLEQLQPPLEQHEMTQTEQLLDEFEYLGAALI